MSETFLVIAAAVLVAASSVSLLRVVAGKTAFDRVLAAGAAGTHAIGLMAIFGFIFRRPDMFVDLALTYALLNFMGALVAGKYLERHPDDAPTEDRS